MRVFSILAVLLLIAVGFFFLVWEGDLWTADEAERPQDSEQATSTAAPTLATVAPTNDGSENAATPLTSESKIIDKNLGDTGDATVRPSFDIVRMDRNCELLVAGRGVPSSVVTIYVGSDIAGEVKASARGEWVFTSVKAITPGSQILNLIAKNPDGATAESAKLVAIIVPDCTKPLEQRTPAIAVLAPKAGEKGVGDDRSVKLLQVPEPKGNVAAAKDLSLGAINYDDKGALQLSGKGKAGNIIQVYANNKPIGSAIVGEDGTWSLMPDTDVATGNYNLRIDQLDENGKVISRVELPFQRAPASDVILAQEDGHISAIVQPGNSLWRIATRAYGEGAEYTIIYQANQDQIRDPDLIYPGQIFKLPGAN
ncbi:MAG: peptidoglycan-binding protein [Sneathiella sp.]|nr:MAG: peptidoglycan-binding protein [Sneathiella sp.]